MLLLDYRMTRFCMFSPCRRNTDAVVTGSANKSYDQNPVGDGAQPTINLPTIYLPITIKHITPNGVRYGEGLSLGDDHTDHEPKDTSPRAIFIPTDPKGTSALILNSYRL